MYSRALSKAFDDEINSDVEDISDAVVNTINQYYSDSTLVFPPQIFRGISNHMSNQVFISPTAVLTQPHTSAIFNLSSKISTAKNSFTPIY